MKLSIISASVALVFGYLSAADIEISAPFIKATPPNSANSAAFMSIKNSSKNDIDLLGGSAPFAKNLELHIHTHENGMTKMVKIPKITIPAGGETQLKPGDLHIMLIGIDKPIKEGDKLGFSLDFSNGETINLKDIEAKKIMHKK